VGTNLSPDLQQIPEPIGGHESYSGSVMLEQRVGGDRASVSELHDV